MLSVHMEQRRFKEGRETTEDDPRHGHPSMSKTDENIENISKLIRKDRRLSIQGLAEITGIDKECVCQILHESFNMSKVCAKMVPKLLTPERKESRMNICADILNNNDTDPGLLNTWSVTDLDELDRLTRRLLTKFRHLHTNSSVIRLYLPRRQGGRGLLNIKNQCLNQEASLRRKLLTNRDPLITAVAREDAGYTPLSLGCELIPVDQLEFQFLIEEGILLYDFTALYIKLR
ncbi:hypothetical protein NQ318_011667 [Aromia moschata]|uniref:Uncharacterized protein n=1 Tax=Aromia moschata TaxID=1265417 RepID=A0AAV8Y126_9CUCU|nr:hypothetical protein NQ318_011667 [Aromia moschata]